ncbi:MAG: hypothetical protein KGI60_01470 [Patescibacteria group bacterium]|nr:hypothetical protein [Patescibacteria group bacterium]
MTASVKNAVKSRYHLFLAWLGSVIYQHPSRKLFVIGVTGTKGKSTVTELINAILEAAGKKTSISSSVRFKIGEKTYPNHTGMSMPGRFFLQRFLADAVRNHCDYAIIETTSQGALQFRHRFIDFDVAVITNLEPEHIEAHGSFENYRDSKVGFFRDVALHSKKKNKVFVINGHARDYEFFSSAVTGWGRIVLFDQKEITAAKLKTRLLGEFNRENIAAAVAFARSQNIDWDTIRVAIESFDGVPGRLEFVQRIPFPVIIDYAHTPDSLEKVYKTLRGEMKKGSGQKLICVLGAAGGGRDMWKRPVMGEIAGQYCDQIILTDEDPFDEDPQEIIDEIGSGIMDGAKKKVRKILDRRDAIRAAVKAAKKGDTVIITGKGSESSMRMAKGRKLAWNEREIVAKILNSERIEM